MAFIHNKLQTNKMTNGEQIVVQSANKPEQIKLESFMAQLG